MSHTGWPSALGSPLSSRASAQAAARAGSIAVAPTSLTVGSLRSLAADAATYSSIGGTATLTRSFLIQYAIFWMLTLSTPYCTTGGGRFCCDRSTGNGKRMSAYAAQPCVTGSHFILAITPEGICVCNAAHE